MVGAVLSVAAAWFSTQDAVAVVLDKPAASFAFTAIWCEPSAVTANGPEYICAAVPSKEYVTDEIPPPPAPSVAVIVTVASPATTLFDNVFPVTATFAVGGVADEEGDGDGVGDTDGLTLGETLGLTDGDADGETLGDTDGVGLTDGDVLGLVDGVGVGVGVGVGDGDGEPPETGVMSMKSIFVFDPPTGSTVNNPFDTVTDVVVVAKYDPGASVNPGTSVT
jgi:hypothetical protein